MKYIDTKDIKESLNKEELLRLNGALEKFNEFIQDMTKTPTDEHIAAYEHWLDCMYDIREIVAEEKEYLNLV